MTDKKQGWSIKHKQEWLPFTAHARLHLRQIIFKFPAARTEKCQIASWVSQWMSANCLILQYFSWPILWVCVLHAYIQPTLVHSIYSAARWSAILSAQGYIYLIHRTTITTHLIPGSTVCFKKSKRQGERATDQEIKSMSKRERMRWRDGIRGRGHWSPGNNVCF